MVRIQATFIARYAIGAMAFSVMAYFIASCVLLYFCKLSTKLQSLTLPLFSSYLFSVSNSNTSIDTIK